MIKKNISLVISLFFISSLVAGCGRPTIDETSDNNGQITANAAPVLPVNDKINSPAPVLQNNGQNIIVDSDKVLKDKEILNILADEGLTLTDDGLVAAGIMETVSFSTKAAVNFYSELWLAGGLTGKAREDAVAALRIKYPSYFKNIYKRPCWVWTPKFRLCNPDGT